MYFRSYIRLNLPQIGIKQIDLKFVITSNNNKSYKSMRVYRKEVYIYIKKFQL